MKAAQFQPQDSIAQKPVAAWKKYARQYKKEVIWVGVFSMFCNVLVIAPTLYMLQIFDRVMISQSELTLIALTLILLLMLFFSAASEWLRSQLLVKLSVKLDQQMNQPVFDALFSSRLSGSEDHAQRVSNDLTYIRQFISGMGLVTFFDAPWSLIYVGILYVMHPILGLTSALFFLIFLVLAVWNGRTYEGPAHRAMKAMQSTNAFVTAKLRNFEIVESLGMLDNLRQRWLDRHERQLALNQDSQEVMYRNQSVMKFVRYSEQSIVLAIGAWLVIQGELSAGAMVAANSLMTHALRPIDLLMSTWRSFLQATDAHARIDQLLVDHPHTVGTEKLDNVKGHVQLVDLTATRPGSGAAILNKINVTFQPGQFVVITGPSGAGKSTLLRCIMGVWPDMTGQVMLDHRPLSALDRDALGPSLGYLPQDIELLDGSVSDNIARMNEPDSVAVTEAAKQVGIHDMILRLPQGYDTLMTDGASQMSGGQRQRLALARAVYGNPRVVLLDEPHASLDEAGVNALFEVVLKLKEKGALILMVVHQSRLVSLADRILVFDAGHMVRDESIHPLSPNIVDQMIKRPVT